ncbi:hypothetical protein FISHEDRAFT_40501 [Fistulina hepatica ATCC 64428]|uniref:SCD domain-containing protein n=1 Tax=Fistulina hepatica ATCC 64428 TaxID=1128425 RepID=A0A0D7AEJ6_9AGAR|nr:hypothetical protein FISHEDRAFT_40501 [Fistulina hepatica ATCC 64428]
MSTEGPRRSQRTAGKRKRVADEGSDSDDSNAQIPKRRHTAAEDDDPFEVGVGSAHTTTKTRRKRVPPKPRVKKAQKTQPARAGDETRDANTSDNPLFAAILNPDAALQSTAEDFLESLQSTPGPAQAELINLILRACGCNESVDGDQALDYDGIVDTLDNFTENLKRDAQVPILKKFRKALSELLERIVISSADLGLLYSSDLIPTLQAWVVAMSSSNLRAVRHTATVVALDVETALSDVAARVEKEAEVVGRQREGEKRRGKGTKGLEAKAAEVRERRKQLAEYLKEFDVGVFIHRYRDLDPTIRAECVHYLGLWFKKHPSHFLDGTYLRYVGWVLSDPNTHVRLEAVKALTHVYANVAYITSINPFTERFRPRLVEMATRDTDVSIRLAVIGVLEALDEHALLEDEEREALSLMVFDEQERVRKGIAGFVHGIWMERRDERLVGIQDADDDDALQAKVGLKALALLLVEWAHTLDERDSSSSDNSGEVDSDDAARSSELHASIAKSAEDRIALAVDAIWDEMECVRDWQGILDLLLLDHSAVEAMESDLTDLDDLDENGASKGKKARKKQAGAAAIEAWRLEEDEESVLLGVFVASLRNVVDRGGGTTEDDPINDITRALINGLPRLFLKYQADERRLADVLLLPTFMNLDLYLEMRMITSYSNLWDDVTKQFLSQTSTLVLARAVGALHHMLDATSLSNTNSNKIVEFEDVLSTALRDAVDGRDQIEAAPFDEDEVRALCKTCTRLAALAGIRDLTAWMEEDEGGKQSSAWDIINAIVERGALGHEHEQSMVEQAMRVLCLHILWKAQGLPAGSDLSAGEVRYRDALSRQRDTLVERFIDFSLGARSNALESVKRAAFKSMLDIHVLFAPLQPVQALASVALELDDETQYRCAGFIQSQIDRYAENFESSARGTTAPSEDGDEDSEDDEQTKKTLRVVAAWGRDMLLIFLDIVNPKSRAEVEREYAFIDMVSTYLRAIRVGALHARHSAVLLAHYGRFGPAFDTCAKLVVDVLREEGLHNDNGELVVSVVTAAVQEAFLLVAARAVPDESMAVQLAKLLATCFLIRGTQLAVLKRLDARYVTQIQMDLLTWLGKRLMENKENVGPGKALKTNLLLFRILAPLALVDNRDALKIKAHMDQMFAQAKIDTSSTADIWGPYHAYEKKLGTSKPKGMTHLMQCTAKGRPRKKAIADGATSEEDASGTDHEEEAQVPPPPRPQPRPRRSTRATMPVLDHGESEEEDEAPPETSQPTPRARPRAKATYGRSPIRLSVTKPTRPEAGDKATDESRPPPPSRKRQRPVSDDDSLSEFTPSNDDEPTPLPVGDLQIKRKRIRH